MTGRELVTSTLKVLGAIAPGESCSASEAVDGLATLNRMLSSWSTEGLLIYTRTRESVAMVSGTAAYTMGTSGTYSATRAMEIEEALIRDETQSPAVETPIDIVSLEQWSAIPQKDTSGVPTALYRDGGYPQDTITLYPKPNVTYKLVLYSLKPLSSIATIDADVSFPPGYEEALIFNLAVRLAPEYGKAASNEVIMIATESKAGLKRANQRPSYLSVDAALVLPRNFNIYTGES